MTDHHHHKQMRPMYEGDPLTEFLHPNDDPKSHERYHAADDPDGSMLGPEVFCNGNCVRVREWSAEGETP